MSKGNNEIEIVESWKSNVSPWINAIENNEIVSRVEITNNAILDTLISLKPKNVLDIGCGEGWLIRELVDKGIMATGIDVIPEFIYYAKSKEKGEFMILSQEAIADNQFSDKFDALVCNFSLLGNKVVKNIFKKASSILNSGGYFIIQTLNPKNFIHEEDYIDGWRRGSWSGFSDDFNKPAPWYFRTLQTWEKIFEKNGFKLDLYEPYNPRSQKADSIIFIGKLALPS